MPITGVGLVANNILKYQKGFINSVNRVMKEVTFMLDREVTDNMSLTDHTQKDLTKLDHPYAARHGSEGTALHDPYWQVHQQSGALLNAKSSETQDAGVEEGSLKAKAIVKIDTSAAPHGLFVVYGTSKMIPRPFMEESKNNVAPAAYEHIRDVLKNLKVQQ